MGANIFGTHFQVLTFGESHGPAMGAVVEGCPAGVSFSEKLIQKKMNRRRPGYFAWTSSRKEPDKPELLSGVFQGITLGTPLTLLVKNTNFKSEDYKEIKYKSRLGHADDVWKHKFSHSDYRGGGRASGRETIGRVLGATVAEMFLKKIYNKINIQAFAIQIGPFKINYLDKSILDCKQKWFGEQTADVEKFLIKKKLEGLSYGGTIQLRIQNVPRGLGQPVFRKLKSDLSAAFMSIGACYEVSCGGGNIDVKNHLESLKDINLEEGSVLHTKQNAFVYGGIRGGISTGEDIIFKLKFKPPASVLDVAKKGRHDPCIVPRATVVVEAMAWLVIADHVLWSRTDKL